MKPYDAADWYWFVASDRSKVYSSKTADYVLATDQGFVDWSADGSKPTIIDAEASLGAVLAPYRLVPKPSGILAGYQAELQRMAQADVVWPAVQETNGRISGGVSNANDKWNEHSGDNSIQARVTRLEESFKAMCSAQMGTSGKAVEFDP